MADGLVGVLMTFIAGALNGSFAAPTKCMKSWKWENTWAVWAFVALTIFPWTLGILTVPDLLTLYRNGGDIYPLTLLIGFGVGFGLSQILFGLAIHSIGISLSFAISIGISTALGSLLPLMIFHSKDVLTPTGGLIVAGVFVLLIGIVVCSIAGRSKEKALSISGRPQLSDTAQPKSFGRGLLLSVLSGVTAPLLNFGLIFGAPLMAIATARGVSQGNQANVVCPPLMAAAAIPFALYCLYLWKKNHSFGLFAQNGTALYWLLGAIMGVLWTGSVVLYGAASVRMGSLGPILGWPLFMSVIIITSNVWGLATGEWRGAGRKPITIMAIGILFLILGFCTLAGAFRAA